MSLFQFFERHRLKTSTPRYTRYTICHQKNSEKEVPMKGTKRRLRALEVIATQVGVLSKRLNESSWFLARELPPTGPTLR